jgi:rhodanese-related sulfurtransferase
VLGLEQSAHTKIGVEELRRAIDNGQMLIVDFADIRRYRSGHIPGAFFALRRNFPGNLRRLPQGRSLVLTSPDGALAKLAAAETTNSTGHGLAVLDGGTVAWVKAECPIEKGSGRYLDEPMELWSPYERLKGAEAEMKAYLGWEVALTKQIEKDGDADFRIMRPS